MAIGRYRTVGAETGAIWSAEAVRQPVPGRSAGVDPFGVARDRPFEVAQERSDREITFRVAVNSGVGRLEKGGIQWWTRVTEGLEYCRLVHGNGRKERL